jgi:CheY-like chemotaxis protein/anti-sigma regulatory factor (Ser/Thr protein kinase)
LLRNSAEQKGLTLLLDIDAGAAGTLLGDANRIRQIVVNLAANAIKYTDSGSVSLHAKCLNTANAEGTSVDLLISVRDSGAGIPEDLLPRLFEEFSQVHGSDSRQDRQRGSGLGLAICKRLVELMDGEIGVGSVIGEGSTFWFRLPVQRVEESKPTDNSDVLLQFEEAHGAVWPSSNARVLVAEDNAVNRKVAEAFLAKMGCQVDIACDGVEVVRMWMKGEYDIVFMDCQMPEADGYSATKAIRAHEANSGSPRTPIIAMTAYAMEGDREACLAAGMDDYLSKPLRMEDLGMALRRWGAAEGSPRLLESADGPQHKGQQDAREQTGHQREVEDAVLSLDDDVARQPSDAKPRVPLAQNQKGSRCNQQEPQNDQSTSGHRSLSRGSRYGRGAPPPGSGTDGAQ